MFFILLPICVKFLIKIQKFSQKKITLEMLCGKYQAVCLGLNVLKLKQTAKTDHNEEHWENITSLRNDRNNLWHYMQ